jgi:hypothetical protein
MEPDDSQTAGGKPLAPNPRTNTAAPNPSIGVTAAVPRHATRALMARGRTGGRWFYLVAGLSAVNWVLLHRGANLHFVVGLGVTLIADNIARAATLRVPASAGAIQAYVLLFNAALVLLFASIGWLSRRRSLIAYGIGITVYLWDALILLHFRDAMGVAFHGLALFFMIRGFIAFHRLSLGASTRVPASRARRPACAVPRNRR